MTWTLFARAACPERPNPVVLVRGVGGAGVGLGEDHEVRAGFGRTTHPRDRGVSVPISDAPVALRGWIAASVSVIGRVPPPAPGTNRPTPGSARDPFPIAGDEPPPEDRRDRAAGQGPARER